MTITVEMLQKAKAALAAMGDQSDIYWVRVSPEMARKTAERLRAEHPDWHGSDRRILRKAFPDMRFAP